MLRVALIATLLVGSGGGCNGDETGADKLREGAGKVRHEAERAQAEAAKARADAEVASKAAEEAALKVILIEKSIVEAKADQMAILDALAAAQNDADRKAAQAKLEAGRRIVEELEQRLAEAKAAAAKAERMRGVKLSPACLENPLAKGCS